jgi:hypothetical protein
MARAPDIIQNQSIPLAATSDAPVLDVPAPPISASNDPVDQQAGIKKEITPAEQAIAAAARKGDLATADLVDDPAKPDPKAKPDAAADPVDDTPLKVDAADPDDVVDDKLPGFAQRAILAEKKRAREYRALVDAAAKTKMGSAEWEAAVNAARDQVIAKERDAVKTAGKEAREAKEALAAAHKELDDIKAKGGVVDPKPAEDPRPTRDAFDDPDAYDEALTAWGKREGVRETETQVAAAKVEEARVAKETADQEALDAQQAEITQIKTTWDGRVEEAKTKYDDFIEVTTKPAEEGGPLVTDAMIAGMMQVDNGPDVAYHLGMNVDEAKRIAELPNPARQLIAIGALAERLANPPRRARPAPPIEPIDTTRNNAADRSDEELDMEAYAAKRTPQLNAARKPFYPSSNLH